MAVFLVMKTNQEACPLFAFPLGVGQGVVGERLGPPHSITLNLRS